MVSDGSSRGHGGGRGVDEEVCVLVGEVSRTKGVFILQSSLAWENSDSGSQESSSVEYPFQWTKYCQRGGVPWCLRIFSIS